MWEWFSAMASPCGLVLKVLFLLPCLSSTQQADALLADDECRDANGQPCALSTLQLNGRGRALVGCHTTVRGERCFREIQWARTVGMRSHPEWYPNLTLESSLLDFQKFLYERYPGKCPIPCGVPLPRKWCLWPNATNLSAPSAGPALSIKVLSYNLFWWNLYRVRQGEGDSAGNLIKSEISEDQPFDVMGFQECESGIRVLEPVGLLEIFEVLQGPHATCLAYRKGWWRSLANGSIDVGEDMRSHYYGRRGVQWIRLEHNTTGRKLLFMNHHGPLEINSGGSCGGPSMANNILRVMQNQSQPGDAVILVGDFNANSASLTIQALWSRMVLLQSGTSFGGVDNIFGNMDSNSVISRKNLGSGGSDHDAIACTVALGNPLANGSAPAPVAPVAPVGAIGDDPITVRANITGISTAVQAAETLLSNPPGTRWQSFWCGLLESDIGYVPVNDSWFRTVRHRPNFGDSNDVASPQRCCHLCQQEPRCKSWTWKDGGPKRCEMFGSAPASKEVVPGYVSGLSAAEASLEAARSALRALSGLS